MEPKINVVPCGLHRIMDEDSVDDVEHSQDTENDENQKHDDVNAADFQ